MTICRDCGREVFATVAGWTTDPNDGDVQAYTCPETGSGHAVVEEE